MHVPAKRAERAKVDVFIKVTWECVKNANRAATSVSSDPKLVL
jgi:hypothetical protein